MRKGWKTALMSEVFDLQMGKTPSRDNLRYWNGTETWVSISDMGVSKYIDSSKEQITTQAVQESGIKMVPKGCVIMSFKLSVGKTAISNKDLYTNEAIMAFKPKEEHILLPDYVYYYLRGYKWDGVNRAAMGLTLNKASISKGFFSYPSLQEQERIVAELDLLTGIIDKQKQQLRELDTLAQSIFYDMFGNPQTDERGWNMEKLSSICVSISDGSHNPPKGGEKSDYLMLSSKNIKDGVLSLEEPRYLSKDEFSLENKRTNVKKGDILLTIVGTIGRCCLFDSSKNIVFQRSVAILKPNDTTNNLFLMYQMIMLRMVFENEAKGVAQKGIYLRQLGNIMVIVPPKWLQESFAQKILSIESQKQSINRSIAESQKLFDYTMDKYFG